jgi:hemerythrin
MTWTDKLSIGIGVIDEDQKKLVGMVNELYGAMQAGHGRESLGRILDGLMQCFRVHFARGEKFFAQIGYAAAVRTSRSKTP